MNIPCSCILTSYLIPKNAHPRLCYCIPNQNAYINRNAFKCYHLLGIWIFLSYKKKSFKYKILYIYFVASLHTLHTLFLPIFFPVLYEIVLVTFYFFLTSLLQGWFTKGNQAVNFPAEVALYMIAFPKA